MRTLDLSRYSKRRILRTLQLTTGSSLSLDSRFTISESTVWALCLSYFIRAQYDGDCFLSRFNFDNYYNDCSFKTSHHRMIAAGAHYKNFV